MEGRPERFCRVGEGGRRHLVLLRVHAGRSRRMQRTGPKERVSGTHLERRSRARPEYRLFTGIRKDVVVELGRVRCRLVQSANVWRRSWVSF